MRYGPAMSAPRRAKPAITFRVSAGCPHDAPRRQTALTSCSPSRGFASRRKRWDDERIAETGLVLMAMSTIGVWLGGYLFDHTGSYQVVADLDRSGCFRGARQSADRGAPDRTRPLPRPAA